jgi:PAS domain S-box-containing protein
MPAAADPTLTADALFHEHRQRIFRQTDRLFAGLMVFQFAAGIVAALWVTPHTWIGLRSDVHPHVYAALVLGGLFNLVPAALALRRPGAPSTRFVVSAGQGLASGLLIHLCGGRIETHFHIFGSLAFLSFYRDWRVLVPATVITAVDHFARGALYPQSVYGVVAAGNWRWLEHAGWVVFEDIILVSACVRGTAEMRRIAERTAESARRNAELTAVRETALDCIIQMDHRGLVTEFNPAAERTFGYARADAVGRPLGDLIVPPHLRAAHEAGLARYLVGGPGPVIGKRIEVPAVRADGTHIPVELAITAVRVDGPPKFVAYVRDISERKRAEEQARHAHKLALVASRTDNAVVITDPQGRIEWVNDGFSRISGYALDEVVGRKPGAVLQGPDTDPATVARIREQLARGEGFTAEIVNYAKDGRKYWLAIEAQPVRDAAGTVTNFIAIESDVTARKAAQHELSQAKEQAEAASRAKSEFLANMSHEIRTPLNGVIGMADLLTSTPLDERQARYAQVIKSSADSLLALINQILDFSKIEAGKLELDVADFELTAVVEDVGEMLAAKAAAKGLELACRVDPALPRRVRGDADRLRQVLVNLVNNAIKFTDTGEIIVRVLPNAPLKGPAAQAAPDAVDVVRFEVIDTGIGIPADRLNRLFRSFSQVDASTTRRYGGTGLGLAISKQLAELMGGAIGVRSRAGLGATFWFTARLPRAAATAPAPAPAAAAAETPAPHDLTGRRVLVVDDNPTHAHILCEQLAAWRVAVVSAPSGAAALRLVDDPATAPFDVAILDLRMPEMDGLALAAALRARPAVAARCRLVLLSGVDMPSPDDYRRAGFCAAMAKPVRQSQLFDALMKALATSTVAAPAAPAPLTPAAPARPGARVLLAEDNDVNQLVATELLARAGYRCDPVGNGRLAVDAVATGAYDLVLMDCQMPELDGFEATRTIRQAERDGGRRRIPIVALTANAVKGDRERCLAAGMDAYVTKPLNPKELFETIESHLQAAAPAAAASSAEALAPAAAAPTPAAGAGDRGTGEAAPSDSPLVPPPSPPSSPPPIDVSTLLPRCMNDVAFLEKILVRFRDQSAATLDRIAAAVAARDPDATARAAHALKGAAANLSAGPVRDLAGRLEELGRDHDLSTADQLLATLRTELDRCLEDIPQALNRATTTSN